MFYQYLNNHIYLINHRVWWFCPSRVVCGQSSRWRCHTWAGHNTKQLLRWRWGQGWSQDHYRTSSALKGGGWSRPAAANTQKNNSQTNSFYSRGEFDVVVISKKTQTRQRPVTTHTPIQLLRWTPTSTCFPVLHTATVTYCALYIFIITLHDKHYNYERVRKVRNEWSFVAWRL